MENSFILRNPSENEIINAIDQNQLDFFKKLSSFSDIHEILKNYPDSEISVNNEVSKFFMGVNHPLMNVVCGANFTEQDVKEKVNILIR